MVKAYLRYSGERSLGVIASRDSNVVLDCTGKLALAASVETVTVWNLRQNTQERVLQSPKATERVTHLCLREGDRPACAAGYSDGSVRLWDYRAGSVLQTFHGHRSAISCLCFSHAGHLLASGSKDTDIVLWDTLSESGIARFRGHVDQVTAVVIWEGLSKQKSEIGARDAVGGAGGLGATTTARLISSSKDRFVRIWSIELQLCLQLITEHQVEVWSLALNSEQDRLVAGSADKYLRVWELQADAEATEQQPLAVYRGAIPRSNGQGNALALHFLHMKNLDFDVLLCQGSNKVLEFYRCHDATEALKRQKRRKRRAHLKKLKKGAADGQGDGQGEGEGEADTEEQQEQTEEPGAGEPEAPRAADEFSVLPIHRCSAKAVSTSWCAATSTILVSLSNNSMESIHMAPGSEDSAVKIEPHLEVSVPGHRTAVRALAVAHDDSLLLSMSAEAVKVWNTVTGRCVRTMPSGYGLCGFFLPGNEHALVGTKEGKLELYDLRVAELAEELQPHEGAVYGLTLLPDQKSFASCSADKSLRLFELSFTEASASISQVPDKCLELPDECLAVACSPNGKYLAVSLLNHQVQLVFADTLKFYLVLYGHRLPAMCLDISSDSQMVASGSADKNVKLWSIQFGNCHKSLRAHEESVMQVRFLPGTHYLASAGRDRELKLWDCDSYELITTLHGHASQILALALSQDAAFIVTASDDGQVRFWKRSSEQLFLSEERDKELGEKFEQEVEREDMEAPGASEAATLRPSRRTVESVRSTERLMEILDEAAAAEEGEHMLTGKHHPCVRVVSYVNTLTASNVYEVLFALPFGHSLQLLRYISRYLEAVSELPGCDSGLQNAAATLETPCQAALITAYVHHGELATTLTARALLVKLRQQMRDLLQSEKDRIGLSIAGLSQLQRSLKRSAGFAAMGITPAAKPVPGAVPGTAPSKRKKKGLQG